MMEAGLIDKFKRKWWSSNVVCTGEVTLSTVQSLKLDTTAGPFILYAATTLLSILLLAGERVWVTVKPCTKTIRGKERHIKEVD